jgi:hypothetical protein
MADVPDDPVAGRVEGAVYGYGELDSAKARGEVPPGGAGRPDYELADLRRETRKLRFVEEPQVAR